MFPGLTAVDTVMREHWATGNLHNRVHMIVGSFLTENHLLYWRH
ncbi:FAD-binding domain-containing protein [Corynebacterium kozikiae]|nr:FAD-binding domain-containing protein [Corynebacterium sp. 76QC2CO]MCQ9342480.1 hypothetical protein [Corynebacterium sp. 76QC2CO]